MLGIDISHDSALVLVAFLVYLVGVALLGIFAHRYLTRGSFVKEYFLGNRGLGPWVLALTVAATAISGGTFMGFPSLIYTNGWIMALWIASYMVGPITTMLLMGKRINQVSRLAGSVTVPDVLRDRFNSPALGIVGSLLILIFLIVNLVAQFKAGANVMETALDLPRKQGKLARAEVDQRSKEVVVHFALDSGGSQTIRVPLPDPDAVLVPEKTIYKPDEPARPQAMVLFFQQGDKSYSKRINFPAQTLDLPIASRPVNMGYLLGLIIFAITVIAYTTYGGFWAVTLTDVLEGLVMLTGVIIMAVLAVRAVPPITIEKTPAPTLTDARPAPVQVELHGLAAATERLRQTDARLVYGPGPGNYLPLGMAFSFFLMWSLIAAGQPSGMVRLMSFKDSASARRAIILICIYYILTYMSLIVIFVCARAIFPREYLHEAGSEARGEPDRIMPEMARHLAHPLVAGLLLAAPYAAIMSTVAAFLLMISSSLVRDLYQRVINPDVADRTLKFASYLITGLVGVVVMLGALNPPSFLQYIIVFATTGLGCAFLVPMFLTLYWRRATKAGILAGMLGGILTVMTLYVLGWLDSGSQKTIRDFEQNPQVAAERPDRAYWLQETFAFIPGWGEKRHDPFNPIFLGGVDTLVWGILVSIVLSVGISLLGRPDPALVAKYFDNPL